MIHRASDFWSTWQLAPVLTVPTILIGYLYFLVARERTVSQRTVIAFYSGIFSFLLVVVTPIGALATTYFWCHMIQHMVLMMVTGPLLVLGSVNLFRPKNVLFLWFSRSLCFLFHLSLCANARHSRTQPGRFVTCVGGGHGAR